MKKYLKQLVVLAAGMGIFCVGFASVIALASYQSAGQESSALAKRTLKIGNATVVVEVATTLAEQAKGLSGRAALAPDAGMLFPLENDELAGFWMKGMEFPLDFVYIREGKVVNVKENVQPTLNPTPFFWHEGVDGVLEVNAGWVASNGIQIGDPVSVSS